MCQFKIPPRCKFKCRVKVWNKKDTGVLITSLVSEIEKGEATALIINMTEKEVILDNVYVSTEPLSEFEVLEMPRTNQDR